jgi:predicted transcriptional regulator
MRSKLRKKNLMFLKLKVDIVQPSNPILENLINSRNIMKTCSYLNMPLFNLIALFSMHV